MKTVVKPVCRLLAITLLGAAGMAGAQIDMPNPGAPGGSFESAVRIVATNDFMIDRFISRWLRTHYPGWSADPHEFQELADERYAVVYISHSDHPSRRVYFRILQSHADPDNRGPAFPF
jgi:hypothetical protein